MPRRSTTLYEKTSSTEKTNAISTDSKYVYGHLNFCYYPFVFCLLFFQNPLKNIFIIVTITTTATNTKQKKKHNKITATYTTTTTTCTLTILYCFLLFSVLYLLIIISQSFKCFGFNSPKKEEKPKLFNTIGKQSKHIV